MASIDVTIYCECGEELEVMAERGYASSATVEFNVAACKACAQEEYDKGKADGESEGYDKGYDKGEAQGHKDGYSEGYEKGRDEGGGE